MQGLNKKTLAASALLLALVTVLAYLLSYRLTGNDIKAVPSSTVYTTLPTEGTAAPQTTVSYTATTVPITYTTAAATTAAFTTMPIPTTVPVPTSVYNILDDDNIRPLAEPQTIIINPDTWYLALVNNKYRMPADYVVNTSPAIPGSDIPLESRVAEWYTAMYNAAAQEGIYLTPYSGYRSYERQTINYNNKTNYYINQGYSETEARAKAAMVIMPPGCSEHNLGVAMDIIDTADNFYTTRAYAWLMEHAADYGFILRYPKDKQAITEVEYEPWHWRYVGVDYAHSIKASGLCLEEYLSAYGLMPAVYTSAVG